MMFNMQLTANSQIRFQIDSIKQVSVHSPYPRLTDEYVFQWPVVSVCGKIFNASNKDILLTAYVSKRGYMEKIISLTPLFTIQGKNKILSFDYHPNDYVNEYSFPWRSITNDDGLELAYVVIRKGESLPYGYTTKLEINMKDYGQILKRSIYKRLRRQIIKHISSLCVNVETNLVNPNLYHQFTVLHNIDALLKVQIIDETEEEIIQ